jgi:hypothetical protein
VREAAGGNREQRRAQFEEVVEVVPGELGDPPLFSFSPALGRPSTK